jgi:hypothetical protein
VKGPLRAGRVVGAPCAPRLTWRAIPRKGLGPHVDCAHAALAGLHRYSPLADARLRRLPWHVVVSKGSQHPLKPPWRRSVRLCPRGVYTRWRPICCLRRRKSDWPCAGPNPSPDLARAAPESYSPASFPAGKDADWRLVKMSDEILCRSEQACTRSDVLLSTWRRSSCAQRGSPDLQERLRFCDRQRGQRLVEQDRQSPENVGTSSRSVSGAAEPFQGSRGSPLA